MSWKFIFNSNLAGVRWGHIDTACKMAKSCGYEFFTWNGWVYSVESRKQIITVDECF